MAEGVDYSFSRPDPAGLVAAGKTFCCRYLSSGSSSKDLSAAEAARLRAAGLDIVSNWERDGHQELLAGRASGQTAARQAEQQHRACGGPQTAPIYFSADFDAQIAQVIEFYRGAVDILGYDRTGCYGGYTIVEGLVGSVVRWGWQTFAWSGGRRSQKAHIYQHTVDVALAGGQVDLDTSLQPNFGQWGAAAEAPAEPPAEEPTLTEVGMFICFGPNGAALAGPGYWRPMNSEEYNLAQKIPGIKVRQVANQREWDVQKAIMLQGQVAGQ